MRLDAAARTVFPVLVCALINVGAYLQGKGIDALVASTFGVEAAGQTRSDRSTDRVSDARTVVESDADGLGGSAARELPCEGLRAALNALAERFAERGATSDLRVVTLSESDLRGAPRVLQCAVVDGAGHVVD